MRLADAIPAALRDLPAPLASDELHELTKVLASGRVARFRRTDYVCSKGHRLAQVLATPLGQVLLIHGAGEPAATVDPVEPWRVVMRHRYRSDHPVALRVSDLAQWLAAVPSPGEDIIRCRCGRHELDLALVPANIAADRQRVLLRRVGQRE